MIENVLANFLGRVLPLTAAFWLSAGLVFAAGVLLNLRQGWKALIHIKTRTAQIAIYLRHVGLRLTIPREFSIPHDFATPLALAVFPSVYILLMC
ncbi:MAG: hypothetical protein K8R77_12145, partial [Anaerolineaceae bacterium]|nr:hypothetical protein [Anaerolineaceae bacterium]